MASFSESGASSWSLWDCGAEGVAARHRPVVETIAEPAHALLRRAAGDAFGSHAAMGYPVVSHGGRRLPDCLDVALLDAAGRPHRMVQPDPGETVRLQLDPDLQLVGCAAIQPALLLVHGTQR